MALSVAWRRSGQFDSPKKPQKVSKISNFFSKSDWKIFGIYYTERYKDIHIISLGSMLSEDIRLLKKIKLFGFSNCETNELLLYQNVELLYNRMIGPFLDYTLLPRIGLGFSRSLALCIVICVAVVGGLNRNEQHLGGGGSSYHNSLKIKTGFTNKAKIN